MRLSMASLAALSLILPVALFAAPVEAQAGMALTNLPDGPFLCHVDTGQKDATFDDSYYLRFQQPGPESRVGLNAIRLVGPPGYPELTPGAFMDDGARDWDSTLVCKNGGGLFINICSGGFCSQGDVFILDVDGATGYGQGDCAYMNLEPSGLKSLGPNDLRLTWCTIGSTTYAPGTVVKPGDQDANTFTEAGQLTFSGGFRHADLNANNFVDAADKVFIVLREDGNTAQISTDLDISLPLPPPATTETSSPPTPEPEAVEDEPADEDEPIEQDPVEDPEPDEAVDQQARDDAEEAREIAEDARDAAQDAAASAEDAEEAALAAQAASERTSELIEQLALDSQSSEDDDGRSVPAPGLALVVIALGVVGLAARRRT